MDTNRLSNLASPSDTLSNLQYHNILPKHVYGQNFIINDSIIKKIISLSDVCKDDFVLEIGPGLGTLSIAILKFCRLLYAFEIDKDMCKAFRKNINLFCPNLENKAILYNVDALKLPSDVVNDLQQRGKFKLVSNLPYCAAAPIILEYFKTFSDLASATVMVQKEIAERICACPGTKNYGSYTVKLSLFANVVDKFNVGINNFIPKPRVESTVIKLQGKNLLKDNSFQNLVVDIIDASFCHKRKTLLNSALAYYKKNKYMQEKLKSSLDILGISKNCRAEQLKMNDFIMIAKSIK